MQEIVYEKEEYVVIDTDEKASDVDKLFRDVQDITKPLLRDAKTALKNLEKMLYSAPDFINAVKSVIPEEEFIAVLTKEQKNKLASGALELMTKKDGTLMANLINPQNKKIVSTIQLKSMKLSPEISQAMSSFATQMQMAQIAEEIRRVQIAVEEVRHGQEYDRLATAYSCQQKLIQAMEIKNPELRTTALLRIAYDAEDSRNLLMQSQSVSVEFIKNQPESFWKKLISGATPDKINSRISEIRESLCAVNMVSLAEAIAYREMGEMEAAKKCLEYYSDYIDKTYLSTEGLLDRLDMIDPSKENYWSNVLPQISRRIQMLPCDQHDEYIEDGGTENGETMQE